jgi:hypothetical protein
MARELKFDLNVESNALLCPNPSEFYSKAYISEDIVDNYRTLPGVKSETKLARTLFTSVLKASTCNFPSTTESLDAIDISVCPVSALGEICRFDLEQSWISAQMVKGSNGSFEVANFMNYYWGEMAKEIGSEIEQIRWRGNTATASFTGDTAFLKLCDGYEKKLAADTDVIDVSATTITSSNVLAEMIKVVNALPAVLKAKRGDLRFYVAPNVALAYELAAAQGNTQSYITQSLGLSFLGIKVVVAEGMSDNTMVLTRKDNLIYAFDGEGDSKALKAVNLEDSVAEPLLRTRANIKIGFEIVNGNEIVYYA